MKTTTIILILGFFAGALVGKLRADTFNFGTLAGSAAGGNGDGLGPAARFVTPAGMAQDADGNIYFADTFNHTIRKMSPSGVVCTLAGKPGVPGSANGNGIAARFNGPNAVAVDASGNVYVADFSNHTIRKITPVGDVSTLAGLAGISGSADGVGSNARFNGPTGVAVDSSNNVFVADTYNQTVRKITLAGVVSTFAGTAGMIGSADGTGSAAQFYGPYCLAVDVTNNLYVTDSANNTVRRITPARVVSTFAGTAGFGGSADGIGAAASFYVPLGIAVDNGGNVFVADGYNNTIRRITPTRAVSTWAGLAGAIGSTDGTGGAARFNLPFGVVKDGSGNVYVGDYQNHTVRKITPGRAVSTLAGQVGGPGAVDATGGAARFNGPNSVAVDSSGNVYVADETANTVRKITPVGGVTTLAGLAGIAGSADGTGSAARFNRPEGVTVDSTSTVYVADQNNHTIRKITPTGSVTTLAGFAGMSGSTDGTGSAARFNQPSSVATDGEGNVYVADSGNHTIRRITAVGEVTTLAGSPGLAGSVDGPGAAAQFNYPYGVAVDASTNVYVADAFNNTIRKITPAGEVSTIAGLAGASGSVDDTGTTARFNTPNSVAVDSANNVYVADSENATIRKITPGGVATTIGGLAGFAGSADGTGNAARFSHPFGVATDGAGSLYVADFDNNTIRKGVPTGLIPQTALQTPIAAAGQFAFGVTGSAGLTVNIETSTNCSNWQIVGAYMLDRGTNYFLRSSRGQEKQFYRAHVP